MDLAALARDAIEEVKPLAEAKHQELIVEAPAELELQGDSAALTTLIRNLLDNAIRYTDESGHISPPSADG